MAEVEISINEDDDMLREINEQAGEAATASSSQNQLRARGSRYSVATRSRYPFEDAKAFSYCQACDAPLAGCVQQLSSTTSSDCSSSIIVSCGHVICSSCRDECNKPRGTDPQLYECPVCREYGTVSSLPGHDSINETSSSYSTGEEWALEQAEMDEVNLSLEDALEDTRATVAAIRGMRALAARKKEQLEETGDRVANVVATHFNHIVVQAMQRCFDVLSGLKRLESTHHSAIERHLALLEKTERQLTVGVEVDERARDRGGVRAESVAHYMRQVAHGLCKPALEQLEESKEYSSKLEAARFDLIIETPDTRAIVERIGKWGERVACNGEDVAGPTKQSLIAPSYPHHAASLLDEEMQHWLEDVLDERPISAAELPARPPVALGRFSDLHARLFPAAHATGGRRELPFQLGERQERETREAPSWMSDSFFGDRISSQRSSFGEDMQHVQQGAAAGAMRESSLSPSVIEEPSSRPVSAAAAAVDDEVMVLERSQQQQQQPAAATPTSAGSQQQPSSTPLVKKVFRKGPLTFVKKQAPPELPRESAPSPPPALRPMQQAQLLQSQWRPSYGTPMPPASRGGPSILRRVGPQHAAAAAPLAFRPATTSERAAVGVTAAAAAAAPAPRKSPQVLLTDPAADQLPKRLFTTTSASRLVPSMNLAEGRSNVFRGQDGRIRVYRAMPLSSANGVPGPRPTIYRGPVPGQYHRTTMSGGQPSGQVRMHLEERNGGGADDGRTGYRVSSVRMGSGTVEQRYAHMNRPIPMEIPHRLRDTPEQAERRRSLHVKGFRDSEINKHFDRESEMERSNLRVVVPTNRSMYPVNQPSTRTHYPAVPLNNDRFMAAAAGGGEKQQQQPQMKKRMSAIERAFTRMFGADGSMIPELAYRRRGRPPKDDPTAPSNIIQQFKQHATQWPPKFDEMSDAEVAELQDLINQLDAASREEEEGERPFPLFENGVKSEEEEQAVSSWHRQYSLEEREMIKAAARERLQSANQGCFVCRLFRNQGNKPRDWQCNECIEIGRPLTPIKDGEIVQQREEPGDDVAPPPRKKRATREIFARAPSPQEDADMEDNEREDEGTRAEEEEEGEGAPIDLAKLLKDQLPVAPRVERRGRPRKIRVPEDPPAQSPQPPKRTPQRESKKRREQQQTAVEEQPAEPQEEGVVGTTRRGRQIKMPAKLLGHEVNTASTTTANAARRSPSVASEAAHSEYSSPTSAAAAAGAAVPSLPVSTTTTPSSSSATSARSSPMKRKIEIKEESPEPPQPRSAMDVPRRGRRRY